MLFASALFPLQGSEIACLQSRCSPSLDWAAFFALVERHRIFPTVYRNLSTHVPELVPPPTLAELKKRVELNRLRTLHQVSELGRLSHLFEQEGIVLCALKGPLLSQQLFGDVGMRTSSDLDLLIDLEAVTRAESLLLSNGYKRFDPASPLTPRQWQVYQKEWRNLSYHCPELGIMVELHWAVAPLTLVSIEEVRSMLFHARPFSLADSKIYTFSEEDLPVYLLIHGSLHSWERLKWLIDFVVWVRQAADQDWEKLIEQMNYLSLQRSLAQGVLLANWLFSATIPESVGTLVKAEPTAQQLAHHSLETILNPHYSEEEKGRFQRFKRFFYHTNLKKDLRYKWSIIRKAWLIHHDWQDLPLPDALFPLYWVLRPFLWFRRYHMRRR